MPPTKIAHVDQRDVGHAIKLPHARLRIGPGGACDMREAAGARDIDAEWIDGQASRNRASRCRWCRGSTAADDARRPLSVSPPALRRPEWKSPRRHRLRGRLRRQPPRYCFWIMAGAQDLIAALPRNRQSRAGDHADGPRRRGSHTAPAPQPNEPCANQRRASTSGYVAGILDDAGRRRAFVLPRHGKRKTLAVRRAAA